MGPGLITGASDDDPAGIATYSQAGAKFGTGLLWTMPLTFPLMSSVQILCARLGRTVGHGLAHLLQQRFHPIVAWSIVSLLVFANVLNLAADVAAMGAAAALILPGPNFAYAAGLSILSYGGLVLLRYKTYSEILRILVISLFAYVATAFTVRIDWVASLRDTVLPTMRPDAEGWAMVVAIFGTTISPYLFFWQSSHEVERAKNRRDPPLKRDHSKADQEHVRINYDTLAGMFLSNLVAFFIILTCAYTLNAEGKTDIESAEEAATALRPMAGDFAFTLFSIGIIGTGLLAAPVLAGSAAFAVAELKTWQHGLDRRFGQAPAFYWLLGVFFTIALAINLLDINVIDLLVLSAVVNGVVAVPLLFILLVLARKELRGPLSPPKAVRVLVWITAFLMAAAVVTMFVTSFV